MMLVWDESARVMREFNASDVADAALAAHEAAGLMAGDCEGCCGVYRVETNGEWQRVKVCTLVEVSAEIAGMDPCDPPGVSDA